MASKRHGLFDITKWWWSGRSHPDEIAIIAFVIFIPWAPVIVGLDMLIWLEERIDG